MFVAALVISLGGGLVGFAAGGGFFDDANTVRDNIIKLADMVTNRDREINDLKDKISQNQNDQTNLNNEITDLKNQLAQKTNEVATKQEEINLKQEEINRKQEEVNKKQQEADTYKQQLDQLQSESAKKDAKMAELARFSQDKVNELDK